MSANFPKSFKPIEEEQQPKFPASFKPEQGAYEKYVQRPGQIAGQAAVAGFKSLPRTGYDLLKTVVSATGGDLSKLEQAEQNAPEWLKSFAKKAFPSYEEVRDQQKEKGKQYGSEKPLAQPEGAVEKGIEKFGRFLGESPAFGGVGGAKGLASLGGLSAGVQVGEEANLGPIGQLVTGTIGALAPGGIKSAVKGITSSKHGLAKAAAKFTPKDKLALQQQIIKDARDAGIKLDLGTISGNRFIQGMQTKLAQSSLTGKSFEDFKQKLSQQVIDQYKNLSDTLGKAKFQTISEAGEALQGALKAERDASQKAYRDLYSGAKKRLTDKSVVYPDRIIKTIEEIESGLKPGSLKSTEQKAVLNFIQDVKKDVMAHEGQIKGAKVQDLINDKIAIHDIVDYEIEGGTKQLLKKLAKDIDETIQQYGRVDPQFAKEYKLADKKFGMHADTFRNKSIGSALKSQDPSQVLNRMNNVQGIRDVKRALSGSADGRELFNDLSRFKLDQIIQKSFEEGASNQVKLGQFGNTFSKGKNRELIKEILPPETFKRLDRLMRTSHEISQAANKFLNTSQSATSLADLAAAGTIMADVGYLFAGNPWPLAVSVGGYVGINQLSKLITNPEFLKAVEEAVLASNSTSPILMKRAADKLLEIAQITSRAVPEASSIKNESP